MALTIEATAGASDANSFVSEAAAIAYMAARLNLPDDWTTVTGSDCTETEKKALIEATRDLNLAPWRGARASEDQALAWPREYVVNPDGTVVDPDADYPYFANDVIPDRVAEATCELALEALRAAAAGRDALDPDPGAVVKRKKTDILETEYFRSPGRTGWAGFARVMTRIGPLIEAGTRIVRT